MIIVSDYRVAIFLDLNSKLVMRYAAWHRCVCVCVCVCVKCVYGCVCVCVCV